MRIRSLVGLALLAFLILLAMLVLTLPANVVIGAFDGSDRLTRAEGNIWSGQARWLQPGHPPLLIEWRWQGGRVWHWQATDAQTELEGLWRPGATMTLPELNGRLSVERVDLAQWLRVSRPTGFLELALVDVELVSDAAPRAQGEVLWRDAGLAGAIQESLGLIRLQLEGADEALRVAVESLEPASVMVRGRIEVDAESYELDLWLRADRGRPELQRALIDLGERQPDGQVRLQLRGASGF